MTDETISRTSAATEAAAKAALQRRLVAAANLLRSHGWSAGPPSVMPDPGFNDLGQHLSPAGRETTYRCPADGKEAWYVRAADRFYHCDGSDDRACLRAMHRGECAWPMPTIDRSRW